jgi:molybdopterin-synthase adenylyltransferase
METNRSTIEMIRRLCLGCPGPDEQNLRVIDLKSVRYISSQKRIARRKVEILCLENDVIPIRYIRNIGTIGIKGQLKLLRSSIAVCGAGGLGGTIIELAARQGIGNLIIIDKDRFEENNLNRQILATEDDLQKSKTSVAARRVKKINSAVTVTPVHKTIASANVKELIKNADVVIDGLDNLITRCIVADACRELEIPFVHGAIAGFSGQLMTIFPQDNGFEAVCRSSLNGDDRGIEMETGNPAATPAVIAAWQVQEAIKIITGIGHPIRNRLLFLDFSEGTVDEIALR